MAGREKKQLGNKQPQVRRETEKTTKGTEPQKQEDVNPKTKESKQKTKDGVNEKRPILTRSTGGVRNKRILPCRDVSVKGSEQKTKRKLQSLARRNSQNIKLSQTCKLNKADISETKLPEDASTSAYDLKLTQSPRLLRTNRITKPDVKTEETNLNEISSSIDASPKIKSKVGRPRKLGTGTTDIRNGAKGRNMPYITRSDSPARVLRNGKRRKLKDPSLFEGLDLGFSKRRRLLSTTRDGSGSELGCKSEPILDDQSSIAGSDISFNDSPKVENGKGIWDSDFDSKTPVEDSKCETSSQEAHSSLCSTIKSETTTDSFLGKSISNRIAELINRNKFLESVQKDPVLNQEETCNIISPTTADSKESISKITANDKSLIDTNSNTFSKGIPSKLTGVGTVEHNCPHNSVKNAIVENRSLETKTKFPPTGTSIKKINSQDLKEFSSHKNGQNPLPVIDTHFTEKSSKKIRTLKNKQPRLFQALRSTSGTFYVVQNTIVKEEIKPITPPCGGRRLSSDLQVLNSEVKMEQPEDTDSTATLNINIDSLEKKTNTRVQPEEMASHNVEGTLHVLDRTISTVNSDVKADTTSNTIEDNKKEHVSPGTSSVNEITILDQIDSKLTSINSNCDNLIISNLKGDSHCNKDSDNKSHCISESVSNNEVHMRRNSGDSTIDYEENLSCKLSDDDVQSNSSNTYDLVNDCKYTTKDCEENVSDCKEGVSEVSKEKSVDCSEDHKEESSNCKNELSNCEVKSADHKEELRECENESSVPKEVFTDQRELIGSKEELSNCEDELGDSMTELNDCAKDLGDDSINLQCKPDSDFSVFDNLTTDKIESISCPDFTVNEVNEISNSTDTSNKISNTNNKNCGMSKSGTTQLDDNLYKIGESVDFNSMNQPHVSMPFSETSRLKTDKQVTPDEVIDSSCSSIRRSSRSSVNKTNAALINCLKSSRKSVKSSALGKSRGMDEDGSVLQSPCVTEDDSTMDSSDITSIENVKNKDALPEEAVGVELAHFSSQDNPSEEGQETKTVVDIDMDEEQIEDVPPSRKTDLTLKKVMEDDPVVQDIGTGTLSMSSNKTSSLESSCVTAIDINSLESENASESHIFSNNELEGPVTDIDNCAASDVTDFTIVDSEKNIDIDDIALQGATMEECLNNEISNNEDGEIQTAETNISEQLSETNVASVKESENNAYVLKRNVQNGIEPALFYSKGNAKDKEIRTKFATNSVDCKSSEIVSTSENTEIIIENEDLKTDCEENKSELVLLHDDKPEVIRDDIICSDDVEMLDNVGDSFSPGVFQGDVDVNGQCELIPSLTLDYRDNEIAPEVRGLEIEELRCEELCSTGGNIVENDIEENLKTSESTSNVADTQTTNMEENVTPEELAIKVSVLSALGLQPLQSSQLKLHSRVPVSPECNLLELRVVTVRLMTVAIQEL
ncbi:hypothetical protein C0J52_12296 [Blattella germanica]|nr:hypothetical protein C0J52_12296 [Blattella germanica]